MMCKEIPKAFTFQQQFRPLYNPSSKFIFLFFPLKSAQESLARLTAPESVAVESAALSSVDLPDAHVAERHLGRVVVVVVTLVHLVPRAVVPVAAVGKSGQPELLGQQVLLDVLVVVQRFQVPRVALHQVPHVLDGVLVILQRREGRSVNYASSEPIEVTLRCPGILLDQNINRSNQEINPKARLPFSCFKYNIFFSLSKIGISNLYLLREANQALPPPKALGRFEDRKRGTFGARSRVHAECNSVLHSAGGPYITFMT